MQLGCSAHWMVCCYGCLLPPLLSLPPPPLLLLLLLLLILSSAVSTSACQSSCFIRSSGQKAPNASLSARHALLYCCISLRSSSAACCRAGCCPAWMLVTLCRRPAEEGAVLPLPLPPNQPLNQPVPPPVLLLPLLLSLLLLLLLAGPAELSAVSRAALSSLSSWSRKAANSRCTCGKRGKSGSYRVGQTEYGVPCPLPSSLLSMFCTSPQHLARLLNFCSPSGLPPHPQFCRALDIDYRWKLLTSSLSSSDSGLTPWAPTPP